MTSRFHGVYTAIVTPFDKNGNIDWDSYQDLLNYQVKNKVSGLVVSGTTGESPTLTNKERVLLVKKAQKVVSGNCSIIVGTGSNCTRSTIENSLKAKALNVSAIIVVTPYYNKPSQNGLFQHFDAVAKAVAPMDVILYDVPTRTACTLTVSTIKTLQQENQNIVGIKDASADLTRITKIKMALPDDFTILSGEDPLFYPSLALGASGIISVASNIFPQKMNELYHCYQNADFSKALTIHNTIFPLLTGVFIETNPTPVKWLLSRKKLIQHASVRPPLCEPTDENKIILNNILEHVSNDAE